MSAPDDDLWHDTAVTAAQHLPRTGKHSLRVTRVDTGEFIAVATVSTTTGPGSEECAAGVGDTWQEALLDLQRRLRGEGEGEH